MKHRSKKKLPSIFVTAITLILTFMLTLTGCGLNTDTTISLTNATINENGELVLTYSDGSEQNLGNVVGKDGEDGADGKDGEKGQDGNITIDSDGSNIALATSKGLQSAVSIVCNFTRKTYGGYYPIYGTNGNFNSTYSSSGSGVIYTLDKENGDAFIITNYHVVYDVSSNTDNGISNDITVYLYGGETEEQGIKAEYVGGSLYYDIAVLRIEDSDILKKSCVAPAEFADSDKTVVGDAAIAIGNPQGEGIAASYGIVSVDSEHITMTGADERTSVSFRVMRIDTPVNPGNSGGGLYNEMGQLIGIVNAKIIDSNVENIGYAIPSNVAKSVADNIIEHCYETDIETVQRAKLGITVISSQSYTEYDSETGYIYIREIVEIYDVASDSVSNGILQKGDIIKSVSFGDRVVEITRQYHIVDLMLDVRAGDTLSITVIRNGEELTLDLTIKAEHITAN